MQQPWPNGDYGFSVYRDQLSYQLHARAVQRIPSNHFATNDLHESPVAREYRTTSICAEHPTSSVSRIIAFNTS